VFTISGLRAPSADVAVAAAFNTVGDLGSVAAAGIDAPLFWTPSGVRRVDAIIRRAMHARGAKTLSGTVQQLNSLRGACLVQGLVAAILLGESVKGVPITETHPKALLWLLGIASAERPHADVRLAHVEQLVSYDGPSLTEHERDAAISLAAACAMHQKRRGWTNLLHYEQRALQFVPGGVAYWMPNIDGIDAA